MAARIAEILERIEKLKEGLKQKNALLAEKDTELSDLRQRTESQDVKIVSLETRIAELEEGQSAEKQEAHSEAYNLASKVEEMTKAQKELFTLRDKVKSLQAELKEARAGSGSTSHQPDPSTSPEPLDDDDDMMGLITEQQNQIQDLEEKLRQAEDTIRDLEQASQPGPAESEAPAAMTTLSPEVKGHLETIATTLSSEETEIVAPDQPDELNGFLARVVDGINHLNRELADALELSEVITVLQEQVVEAEVDNENLSNEVGELKEQLGGLQTELGELKELLAEKDEVIAEQQLQLIDPPS